MQGIGDLLRRERIAKNYSLEDIAEKTKIRVTFLKAIEEEQFEKLPGAVYAKGFVTSYLKCLGIQDNPEVIAIMKNNVSGSGSEEKVISETIQDEEAFRKKAANRNDRVRALEERPLDKKRLLIVGLSLLAIIALLGIQWLYTKDAENKSENNGLQEQPVMTGVIDEKTESMQEENNDSQTVNPIEEQTPAYEGLELRVEIINLTKGAVDQCWVEVKADGQSVSDKTLTEGQVQIIKASESIRIHMGNAGAVQLQLNGHDLGKVGSKGEVITKEFTMNDVRALEELRN